MKAVSKAVLRRIFIKPLKYIPYALAGLSVFATGLFFFLIMLIFFGWLVNIIIPSFPKENLWIALVNSFLNPEGSEALASGSIGFILFIIVSGFIGLISSIINKIKSIIDEEKMKNNS